MATFSVKRSLQPKDFDVSRLRILKLIAHTNRLYFLLSPAAGMSQCALLATDSNGKRLTFYPLEPDDLLDVDVDAAGTAYLLYSRDGRLETWRVGGRRMRLDYLPGVKRIVSVQ